MNLYSKRYRDAALEDLETVQTLLMGVQNRCDADDVEEEPIHRALGKAMNDVKRAQRALRKHTVDRL